MSTKPIRVWHQPKRHEFSRHPGEPPDVVIEPGYYAMHPKWGSVDWQQRYDVPPEGAVVERAKEPEASPCPPILVTTRNTLAGNPKITHAQLHELLLLVARELHEEIDRRDRELRADVARAATLLADRLDTLEGVLRPVSLRRAVANAGKRPDRQPRLRLVAPPHRPRVD